MTKHGNYGIGGEKLGIFPLTFCTTTHYTIHLPQISPPPTKNPTPSSSRENLSITKTPISLFHKAGFAKMGHASQSLPVRMPRGIIKGKSKRVRAFCGESEPLPRLMRRGFEGDQTTLPLDSYSEAKMPIKASEDEGLRGRTQIRGWREKSTKNAVLMRVGSKRGWRNLWLCVYVTKVYGIITTLPIL